MNLLRDLRYGFRTLLANKSFAAAALAVLALGVGASTAVFSVLRGVMLSPLPYREPHRLVLFRSDLPGYSHEAALTAEEYHALRDRPDVFEAVAVLNPAPANLTSPETMAAVTGASVTDNFFDTLGVRMLLGRAATRRDLTRAVGAVSLGYEVWQRRFHSDPDIVGRQIEINNRPVTVTGVLPDFQLYLGPGIPLLPRVDVWTPRTAGYDDDPFRGQIVIARLRQGESLEAARAAVTDVAARLVAGHPASYKTGPVRLSIAPVDEEVVRDVKPALVAIAGSVAFVLVVACANLTNLLLARASARGRELATRVAIGASRGRILRQLAAEGLVIGTLGAGAGLLLARWAVDVLVSLAPATLPRREAIHLDGPAAAFAVATALLCAVLVSAVPAWHVGRRETLTGGMKGGTTPSGASTTRGLLIASQLALSLVLLVGAGLMTRAFISLRAVPLGFDPDRVATMSIALDTRRFNAGSIEEARTQRLGFYRQLREEVRHLPGIEEIGIGLPAPLRGGGAMAQRFSLGSGSPERQAEGIIALAGYLETLRVPLVEGRYFTTADDERSVVIVDLTLARELWPDAPAAGRRLLIHYNVGEPRWVEVVGVVAHVQNQELRQRGLPQIWVSHAVRSYAQLDLVARASDPAAAIPAIERTVYRLGTGRPVHDVSLLSDNVARASADTRFALAVLAAFAALAVALTAVGVYGVVAYSTARRTREIAVRIALGADAHGIVSLVLRDGLIWTGLGIGAGMAGALMLSRYLKALLFQVGERDPLTFGLVAVLLASVAFAATAFPARRAVRVDPMLALRSE